jgi:hypothetical protein
MLGRLIITVSLALSLLIGNSIPGLARPLKGEGTQTTASYVVALNVGPAETMLMPEQAQAATSGEVMLPMPGMPMDMLMLMPDYGQSANHHLEVHVRDAATGALIDGPLPSIRVVNPSTAESWDVASMAMYGVDEGPSDLHFGNNLYLADGVYVVTVQLGDEVATFLNVAISAGDAGDMATPGTDKPGTAMPGMNMPGM